MVETNKILQGDALDVLRKMPNESVDLVVTSPPYFQQRDYGGIGIEIFDEYVRYAEKRLQTIHQPFMELFI